MKRHFASIHRFFLNKGGQHAGDLVQQTFERTLYNKNFEGRSSFRTYLFAIARNVLYEHLRKLARNDGLDFSVSSLVDLGVSPSQELAQGERRRRLVEALQSLPIEQQVLLELVYWEELGLEEVAQILDVPVGTTKSRLAAGRQALKKRLGDAFSDFSLK